MCYFNTKCSKWIKIHCHCRWRRWNDKSIMIIVEFHYIPEKRVPWFPSIVRMEKKINSRTENPFRVIVLNMVLWHPFCLSHDAWNISYSTIPHKRWMNSSCRLFFGCQSKWFCYIHFVNLPLDLSIVPDLSHTQELWTNRTGKFPVGIASIIWKSLEFVLDPLYLFIRFDLPIII